MDIEIPFLVAFVFLALLLRLIRSYITSSRTKPSPALRLPPGPWQLPLIGSRHHLLLSRFSNLPHRALREMSGTYGPLMMLRFGSVPTLVVSSAEAAREVMRTHDLAFCNRHLGVTLETISCGGKDIICSPYNAHWRELRKLCMLEIFSQRRVLSFRPVREAEVARLLRSISDESSGGLQFALTNEIVSTVIFDIFSARSETSSTVLVRAMSELVKNPQVMHKAHSEVTETFKGQDKITEDDGARLVGPKVGSVGNL